MKCIRSRKVSDLGGGWICVLPSITLPFMGQFGSDWHDMLMCLHAQYIMLIFQINISNSFKVINLFVFPL